MKLAYIAGPYRAPTQEGIELNIASAKKIASLVAQMGYAPLCPHMALGGMDKILPALGDDFWLAASMEMMRRCDLVVLCHGASGSAGTQAEIDEAKRLGIAVYPLDILACV